MPLKIRKTEAIAIAKKLKAEPRESGHKAQFIRDAEGTVIAVFGINHGSKKDAGHGWVHRSLKCDRQFAYELASCTKTREDYLTMRRLLGNQA